jgi:hypothetical protein
MIYMSLEAVHTIRNAEELEEEGKPEEAAKVYEDIIRSKPLDEHPYNRLMIIYRKLKQPREELRVIQFALKVFEAKYLKKSRSRKLTDLSNALMKTAGLGNGKGKILVYPEPIGKWHKRKELVEKKLKK